MHVTKARACRCPPSVCSQFVLLEIGQIGKEVPVVPDPVGDAESKRVENLLCFHEYRWSN